MLMGNRYLRLNYSHYNKTTLGVIGKYQYKKYGQLATFEVLDM